MDTWGRIREGTELLIAGKWKELSAYLQAIRLEDSLAAALLEISLAIYRYAAPEAIRKAKRLISRVSDNPWLAVYLFNRLGTAFRMMGELEAADNYFLRALDIAKNMGAPKLISTTRLNLLHNQLFRAEFQALRQEIPGFLRLATPPDAFWARCIWAELEIASGNLYGAQRTVDSLLEERTESISRYSALELKAMLLRMNGDFVGSRELYLELARNFLDFGAPYAAVTCMQVVGLCRFVRLDLPKKSFIRKCLALARKGSWGEQAAARGIEAFLEEDDTVAASGLLDAADGFYRASQPVEAFTTALSAAYLAWLAEAPVFPKALRFLSLLAPMFPGFKKDRLLGEFFIRAEPLIAFCSPNNHERGIKAYLIEGPKVFVDGREIHLDRWYNQKAARALIYLLLSPRHRISGDHLFYLLWPRKKYTPKNRELLYVAIYNIRKGLGDPSLLIKKHDFYQLEDVWTDLDEMAKILRRADVSPEPYEKNKLLARAREMCAGELLPEMIDDRQVEEYKAHYARLKARLSELFASGP